MRFIALLALVVPAYAEAPSLNFVQGLDVGAVIEHIKKQATEEKVSLGEQRTDIESLCAFKGYEIVEWYQDIGSGASKNRKDFKRMLKDAMANEFDMIVCWK